MNSLTVLNHKIHQMDGLYSLKDLHRASGGQSKHKPANFMRNEETQAMIAEIEQGSNLSLEGKSVAYNIIHGGNNRGTYVCKELVYRYAMWINPKFALAVIRTFDNIATGLTLQERFQIADKEAKSAEEMASHAGYTLNYVGKKVKPEKKRIRDALFEQLQPLLPFLEFNKKSKTN